MSLDYLVRRLFSSGAICPTPTIRFATIPTFITASMASTEAGMTDPAFVSPDPGLVGHVPVVAILMIVQGAWRW